MEDCHENIISSFRREEYTLSVSHLDDITDGESMKSPKLQESNSTYLNMFVENYHASNTLYSPDDAFEELIRSWEDEIGVLLHDDGTPVSEEQAKHMKGRRKRPSLPLAVKNKIISLRDCKRLPQSIINFFNLGDLEKLACSVKSAMHPRCIFRVTDPQGRVEHVGPRNVLVYYDTLQRVYPDAIFVPMKVKIVKNSSGDNFLVIRSKSCFTGTRIFSEQWKVWNPRLTETSVVVESMDVSEEEKEILRMRYEDIKRKGQNLEVLVRFTETFFVDVGACNKIVYMELNYKFISFKASHLDLEMEAEAQL